MKLFVTYTLNSQIQGTTLLIDMSKVVPITIYLLAHA